MIGDGLLEHARLSVLLTLRHQPGHAANVSFIRDDLARWHFVLTSAETNTLLRWLGENGLITLTETGAVLTDFGVMVTNGQRALAGVHRPSHDTVQRLALAEAARLGVSRLGG